MPLEEKHEGGRASSHASVSHGGDLKVHSGVFTINADGTCISKTVFSPPSGEKIAREVKATLTI